MVTGVLAELALWCRSWLKKRANEVRVFQIGLREARPVGAPIAEASMQAAEGNARYAQIRDAEEMHGKSATNHLQLGAIGLAL